MRKPAGECRANSRRVRATRLAWFPQWIAIFAVLAIWLWSAGAKADGPPYAPPVSNANAPPTAPRVPVFQGTGPGGGVPQYAKPAATRGVPSYPMSTTGQSVPVFTNFQAAPPEYPLAQQIQAPSLPPPRKSKAKITRFTQPQMNSPGKPVPIIRTTQLPEPKIQEFGQPKKDKDKKQPNLATAPFLPPPQRLRPNQKFQTTQLPKAKTQELGQPGAGNGQKQPETTKVPVLPPPQPFEPFGPGRPRLPAMATPPKLGATPVPTKKDLERFKKYISDVVDPQNTFDLIVGRIRLLVLKQAPTRVQIADPEVADYNLIEPKEMTILGRKVGTTVLNLWFADPKQPQKEAVISYLVRVLPDPEKKRQLEAMYEALAHEINRLFPDSYVELSMVGDKVAVKGEAKDIAEGTQIIRIVRANAPKKDEDQEPKVPLQNIQPVIRPGDITAPTATPGLQDFLTAGGPKVINLLRIPGEQQVMLKVTVAEVNRAAARSIGLNFSLTNNSGTTFFNNRTGLINFGGVPFPFGFGGLGFSGLNPATNIGGGIGGGGGSFLGLSTNNLPVLLDNGQINLAINALRTLNYARSLAEPNLTAMNGQTATFLAGGQFPVPIISGLGSFGGFGGGLQGVSFVPFGVQLNFTPYITDRNRIRLAMAATVSTRNLSTGTSIGGANVSGLTSRRFQTTVELRDGETLAVAGLIQNNLGAQANRVPLFGDVPILNHLLGFDKISHGEQELVVLVTPILVHPLCGKELPPLPGSDLFEPGDLEFYLLGRLESRRRYDYRSSVMTDIDRMRAYHRCEMKYLFGPHGHIPGP